MQRGVLASPLVKCSSKSLELQRNEFTGRKLTRSSRDTTSTITVGYTMRTEGNLKLYNYTIFIEQN